MAPHILIVDADRNAARVTGALIGRVAPHTTLRYASTPYQGWLAAQCSMPDMLIIDPGPHNPANTLLIQLCTASWPQLQIVVLTLTRATLAQCRADVHIDKSVTTTTLVDTLRTVIHGAESDDPQVPWVWDAECRAPVASA